MTLPRTPPRGVVWLAALLFLLGLLRILFGLAGLFLWGEPAGVLGIVVRVVDGVVLIAVSGGLAYLKPWAWWAALGLAGLDLLAIVSLAFVAPGFAVLFWLSGIVDLVVLGYLLPRRRPFRRPTVTTVEEPFRRTGRFER